MEGKKGLPHLFNNGKPSEMSDKDFYEFIKWLDEEDGSINTNNAKINEKLDGSSQFFGLDDNGFFWEKFGSDQRFYSEEEIPEYWAGYRELFSDMKEALDDYLFEMVSGGFTQYKEAKVQIEVITAAGSHNENNYQINLVPYRKDAFKSKGCLSIIQILLDGENFAGEDTYKNEIKDILSKYDYTVYAGYSIEDFEINLFDVTAKVLRELEDYPFEDESDKFKIRLAEPEDVLDLPTRKYNQSQLKKIFAEAKEIMAEKILSDLKGSTGALTENGMFEGLAIVLNNGMAFKVNSPDFKAAFLKHHQDAVARKMNKVTEAKEKEEKTEDKKPAKEKKEKINLPPADLISAFGEINFPKKGPAYPQTSQGLDEFINQLIYDLKERAIHIRSDEFKYSWKTAGSVISTSELDGSAYKVPHTEVSKPEQHKYFVYLPHLRSDSRDYVSIVFFRNKNSLEFASVKDALDFPADHVYGIMHFHEHKEGRDSTADTKIQECMQGLACEIAQTSNSYTVDSLSEALKKRILANGLDSIAFSGNRKIALEDFTLEKLEKWSLPAAKTGMAFLKNDIFSYKIGRAKAYHPDMDGPLKEILAMGKKRIGKLSKDSWNPTDILMTDIVNTEKYKQLLTSLKATTNISEYNQILKEYCLDENDCFIPLSLKLNLSKDREESIVEKVNLEESEADFHVSTHYANANGVGNEIDIYATINGKPYKFYIRCNGGSQATIEGQHEDVDKYFSNAKFVDDTDDSRSIVDRDDIDIEAYKVNEKDNTTSFLGKAKSVLFSAVPAKELAAKKKQISFDMTTRNKYHEGSLPWRLIELAQKITNPNIQWKEVRGAKHDPQKAELVAKCATELAYLIVAAGWSTDTAIIYLLTCSMKMNYGNFVSFAPLYKIS